MRGGSFSINKSQIFWGPKFISIFASQVDFLLSPGELAHKCLTKFITFARASNTISHYTYTHEISGKKRQFVCVCVWVDLN